MCFLVAVVLAALLSAAPAAARPGDLDHSFGDGGRIAFEVGDTSAHVAGLALLDGRRPVLSVGAARLGVLTPTLLRLTAGGRLASSTAFPPPAGGPARIASGHALTSARFMTGEPPRYALTRLADGSAVTLTVPSADGVGSFFEFSGFGVDGAGRALLTGTLSTGGGTVIVARFQPGGQLDTAYGSGGIATLGRGVRPTTVLVKRDGRAYVALTVAKSDQVRLMALGADGRPLAGFTRAGLRNGRFAALRHPTAVVAGPAGRLLMTGVARGRKERTQPWIVRLDARGRLDRRFGERGLAGDDRVLRDISAVGLVRDRQGRLVVGGSVFNPGSGSLFRAAAIRFTAGGRLDRSFGFGGVAAKQLGRLRGTKLIASEAHHVAIDDRGRIVLAGATYDDQYLERDDVGRSYPAVARLKG